MKKIKIMMLASLLTTTIAFANQQLSTQQLAWTPMIPKTASDKALHNQFIQAMNNYYKSYHDSEYFSGMSIAVYVPERGTESFYLGTVSQDPKSGKVDQNTLFDIGSITKSFTGAIILQLEKQGKLTLNDTVGKWLPEYSKWGTITIEQLLNMTSGLPNYTNSPSMNYKITKNLNTLWSNKELLNIVYPSANLEPTMKPGYEYTNTGYLLAAMIAEKASKQTYNKLLQTLIKSASLQNSFYPIPHMNGDIKDRMAHGYGFNPYENPELLGKDVSDNNLSWAGPAGAIVANSADIIQWVNALFVGKNILDAQQKAQLTSLVSVKTGQPIKQVNPDNPMGFGLGVIERYDPNIGKFWFYEGETLGFRAVYMYIPCNGVIIVANINSAVYSSTDRVGELMQNLYKAVISSYGLRTCIPST